VAPALEEAREEAGNAGPLDFSEHIDRVIEDLQRHDFEAAWTRYLNALSLYLEHHPSDNGLDSIMAWRIERAVQQGNISGAEELIRATHLTSEKFHSDFYDHGRLGLYKYLVEVFLHSDQYDKVLQIRGLSPCFRLV
jgi:hypothetical protein